MNANSTSSIVKHPGEKIADCIQILGMSQKELSIRTGFSEKHISTVLNGSKDVSITFAKRVENATGLSAEKLMQEQVRYDAFQFEKEERNHIQAEEFSILRQLHDVSGYLKKINLLGKTKDEIDAIVEIRKFLGVSNLCTIPEITYNAAYRAQVKSNSRVNPYVLFAWVRMCERLTDHIDIASTVNTKKLRNNLPKIKELMFAKAHTIQTGLRKLFAECGIAFKVVEHFVGAPVQGFIKESHENRLILCLTVRQKRQDIFWFTLFHEIAHILHGDVKQRFVDFSVKSDMEAEADVFAGEVLLPSEAYRQFLLKRDTSFDAIHRFAMSQGVPDHIVIGRLLRDEFLSYNTEVAKRLPKYILSSAA